jgi:hypothetical protein
MAQPIKQRIKRSVCPFNTVIFLVKVAVNVAVLYNFVAVKGCQMAVILGWSGSEGLLGSGNTAD